MKVIIVLRVNTNKSMINNTQNNVDQTSTNKQAFIGYFSNTKHLSSLKTN